MKRNIQPVIFATDDGLWKKTAVAEGDMESSYDPEVYLSSYISVDEYGTLYYASQTVLKELFTSKEYLFEGMPDCQAGNPLSLDSCKSEYAETNTIYSFPGSFLGNTILNEGGAIIVVDKTPTPSCGLDAYCWSGEQYYSKVKSRSLSTQVICPNCMVSVAAGYGSYSGSPEGKFDMEERLKEISYIFQYVTSGVPSSEYMNFTIPCEEGYPFDSNPNFFCFSPMLDAVDVVSLNIVLRDGDEYCGLQGEERHDAILGNMTQLGIATMKRFGKPIVISDFTIDRSGSCWTEQSAANFMAYLSTHSDDLVKAGYLGLIYGDFKSSEDDSTGIIFNSGGTPTVPDYRGDFFSGMFTASRNFAGHEFITFYNEVIVSEECGCIPCGPGDSVCNGKYQGTGPRCDGYEPGMKWPEICIREDLCKVTPPLVKVNSPFGYVTTAADKIACDLVYNDGSKETVYFELSSIRENPGIYRDVIASLETNTPFCFPTGEGEGLITYVASKQSGYSASPLVFSKDGNQSVYCDPTSGLLDSFCGYYPPIGNYQMSCRFSTGEESQDEGATPGPGDMYDTPFVTS